jgi:hypothetical protein
MLAVTIAGNDTAGQGILTGKVLRRGRLQVTALTEVEMGR